MLDRKTAIVCGASQGIGASIALQFAALGANVIMASRSQKLLEDVLNKLDTSKNQDHHCIICDFSFPYEAINKIKPVIEAAGIIHILVNNTGGPNPGSASESSPEEYHTAFNQHLIMSQLLTQNVIEGMKRASFGRIINIISIGLKQPIINLGVSNVVRGAMGSWSKTLSRELAPCGITVNNILPGHTKTQRHDHLVKSISERNNKTQLEVLNEIISKIPVGRLGKPEEIAYAVAFLASDFASFINGINLPVDGGFLTCI